MESHWQIDEVAENAVGFVYVIINKLNKKTYIGKKFYYSTIRKKPLKGKKRTRVITKESNWRTYCSSSDYVKADIKKYGKENFTFKIIKSYDNKTKVNYAELELLVKNDVLDGSDKWYNGNILGKYFNGQV